MFKTGSFCIFWKLTDDKPIGMNCPPTHTNRNILQKNLDQINECLGDQLREMNQDMYKVVHATTPYVFRVRILQITIDSG